MLQSQPLNDVLRLPISRLSKIGFQRRSRAAQNQYVNAGGTGRSGDRPLGKTFLARELFGVHRRFPNRTGARFNDRWDGEIAWAGRKNALRLTGSFEGSRDPSTPQILAL